MTEASSRNGRTSGWLMLIPAIIAIAVVFYGLDPTSRNARLYFLNSDKSRLVAENRELALMGSMEERSQTVLGELMLGPFGHSLQPLFSEDARIQAVMHRNNRLFVDIEVPDITDLNVSFGLIINAFEKTLAGSVPGTGSMELFINGNLVSQ